MKKLLALAAASALTARAAPIAKMKSQALLVYVEHTDAAGKKGGGMGTAFPISATHAVTNWHVCCMAPEGTQLGIAVAVSAKEVIKVKSVRHSKNKDLGILELEKPMSAPPVELVRGEFVTEGQEAWVVGFPGASMNVGDIAAAYVPSLSKGIVSKFFSKRGLEQGGPAVRHIQTTAAVNKGNSGGPLFDECGRVIGVVAAKALTSLGDDKAYAEGVNLAIAVDELLPELDSVKASYRAVTNACNPAIPPPAPVPVPVPVLTPPAASAISPVQWATLGLAGAALLLSLNRRVRTAVVTHATQRLRGAPAPAPWQTPPAPQRPVRLAVRGVSGAFAGQTIPLTGKPCVMGRDAAVSNLVFPHTVAAVSKRHCQVRMGEAGRVIVEDAWSSNGTFTAAGERIAGGQPREMRAGERFYVGSPDHLFEIVEEPA